MNPKSPEYRDLIKKSTIKRVSLPSPNFRSSVSSLPPKTPKSKKVVKKRVIVNKTSNRNLTGDKNVDLLILSKLDDRNLFNFCLTDKYASELCKNEDFWRNRFLSKFGQMAAKYKSKNTNWRKYYLKTITELDKEKIFAIDPEVVNIFEKELKEKKFKDFYILDNGGQPFKIHLEKETIGKLNATIQDNTNVEDEGEFARTDEFSNFSMQIDQIDQIWLGTGAYDNYFDKSATHYIGNTALLVKGQTVYSLASDIEQFQLGENEKIIKYISTVGNNAVPYGWIQSNLGYYALSSFNCDTGFLPNKYVKDEEGLDCWSVDEYPFSKREKIKGLQTLIPRSF